MNSNNFLFFLLISAFPIDSVRAQSSAEDSLSFQTAFHNSLQVYHKSLYPPTSLYNGSRYAPYFLPIKEGHPFLISPGSTWGSLVYDQVPYDSLLMIFDLVRQKLIVYNPAGDAIILHDERISSFYQHQYSFIRITGDSTTLKTGFYAILHNGKYPVVGKRVKTIRTEITLLEGEQGLVNEAKFYYIRKDKIYYPVQSRKSILKLFPDKKERLQQFIRKEKLSFRKSQYEESLVKLIQYLEEISY